MNEINRNAEIARILFDPVFDSDVARLRAFEAFCADVYEDGYDQAAQDITLRIQSCIPGDSRTVEEARYKGAWQDAAKIALNHLGKLSRTGE